MLFREETKGVKRGEHPPSEQWGGTWTCWENQHEKCDYWSPSLVAMINVKHSFPKSSYVQIWRGEGRRRESSPLMFQCSWTLRVHPTAQAEIFHREPTDLQLTQSLTATGHPKQSEANPGGFKHNCLSARSCFSVTPSANTKRWPWPHTVNTTAGKQWLTSVNKLCVQ